jgi:hypothetical protein
LIWQAIRLCPALRELAVAFVFAFVLAFLSVIPAGNLLFAGSRIHLPGNCVDSAGIALGPSICTPQP